MINVNLNIRKSVTVSAIDHDMIFTSNTGGGASLVVLPIVGLVLGTTL